MKLTSSLHYPLKQIQTTHNIYSYYCINMTPSALLLEVSVGTGRIIDLEHDLVFT